MRSVLDEHREWILPFLIYFDSNERDFSKEEEEEDPPQKKKKKKNGKKETINSSSFHYLFSEAGVQLRVVCYPGADQRRLQLSITSWH